MKEVCILIFRRPGVPIICIITIADPRLIFPVVLVLLTVSQY